MEVRHIIREKRILRAVSAGRHDRDHRGGRYLYGVRFKCCSRKGLDSLTEDDLHEMLRFANAASSIITTRKGALKVMPKREEIISVLTKE